MILRCAFEMRVGLTGGIGCGKSTVVQLFAEAGWRTLESDRIVAELLAGDLEVRAELQNRFRSAVFDTDGGVDRKALAAKVFADEDELRWLETLLHPRVRGVWADAIQTEPKAQWLVEIPLLFEKRLESLFDLTVCVSCPHAVSRCRMVDRGYSGEQFDERRLRQMPLDEKVRRADHVILNAGSLDFLKRQTTQLIAYFRDS